ncbi:MAG TPA: hypothetical protein VIG55_09175 [Methylosinus sp.]
MHYVASFGEKVENLESFESLRHACAAAPSSPQLAPTLRAGLSDAGFVGSHVALSDRSDPVYCMETAFMKIPMMIFLSAALIAPPQMVFAAAGDPAVAPRYCSDPLGRRIVCPPTQEGRSVGEVDDDTPWLIGGGLLLAGGVAAAAIVASSGDSGGGGGALFLSPTTVNNYYTTNNTTNYRIRWGGPGDPLSP